MMPCKHTVAEGTHVEPESGPRRRGAADIGWQGGVPLLSADGRLIATAFSGFRGIKDIEILERSADAVGLTVKRS